MMTTKEEQEQVQGGDEWLVDMPPKEIAAQKLKQQMLRRRWAVITLVTLATLATAGGGFLVYALEH